MSESEGRYNDTWQISSRRKPLLGGATLFAVGSIFLAFFVKWPTYVWIDGCLFVSIVLVLWRVFPMNINATQFVENVRTTRTPYVVRYFLFTMFILALGTLLGGIGLIIYLNGSLPHAFASMSFPKLVLFALFCLIIEWGFSLGGLVSCYGLLNGVNAARDILRRAPETASQP